MITDSICMPAKCNRRMSDLHRSTDELETAIKTYIDAVNANPRPFVWTKSANDILASVKRFCLATLKTAEIQIAQTSESGR
jgi:hypothetical protein